MRPSATGRRRVRIIRRSSSRSSTWLIAAAPQATSAVPTHVDDQRRRIDRPRRHVVAAGARRDDERVQPRLREDDEIVDTRRRRDCAAGIRGHDDVGLHAVTACGAATGAVNRTRYARSVSTSDVTKSSAPVATCAVLTSSCLPVSTTEPPSAICSDEQRRQHHRRPHELRPIGVAPPDVEELLQHQDRHHEGADAMDVVNRDLRCPGGRNQAAEDERKVGNREPRAGVTHRRAEQDLHVHRRRQHDQPRAQPIVVDRREPRRAPARGGDSASVTVRPKKICARPAWLTDTASGRRYITVMPPSTPCSTTAPSATKPRRRTHRRGSTRHSQITTPIVSKPDGGRDQPVPVLVEDAADHLVQRERHHRVAVGRRPVGDRQARARARDHPAGGDQEERRARENPAVPVKTAHVLT